MTRITNLDDVETALAALLELDPRLRPLHDLANPLELRLQDPGFAGLAEIVVSQQVSKTSAAAMFGRLTKLVAPLTAQNVLLLGDTPLIAAGLSRAKQSTLTRVATAMEADRLDLEALCHVPASEAVDRLTAIKGIGPWTAEVFLLFCAGHPDIFPSGDVALQHAVGVGLGLSERPSGKELGLLAEAWTPWRGIAARLFWAYYAHLKSW